MSSRPQLNPVPVILNGNLATTLTSLVTVTQKLSQVSYAFTWSGATPVATVNAQVSNDYSQNADGSVNNAGTWNNLPLSTTPSVSGNTGTGFINIDANAGYALRVQLVPVSGTGTVTVVVSGKVA